MIEIPLSSNQPSVVLKLITPLDAVRLGEAFANMDPWQRYGFAPTEIASSLASEEPGAPRYAIFRDGALAGAMLIRTLWLRGPYLQFFGLMPDHQNAGIGSAVLQWFEQTARAGGDRNLWVATSDFNLNARRFYEQHGFQYVATLDDLIQDGAGEILLRKKLCSKK
jgi:ribosomal protein S18 acetylase RimI-like enzyme